MSDLFPGNCQCYWNEQNDAAHQRFASKVDANSKEQVRFFLPLEFVVLFIFYLDQCN